MIRLFAILGIKSPRSSNNARQIIYSAILKAASILLVFLIVPQSIEVLGTKKYGLWLAVSSFLGWFAFLDLGLASALRNRFTEELAKENQEYARKIISNTYLILGVISLFLFTVLAICLHSIPWNELFNSRALNNQRIEHFILLVFGLFCLQWLLDLVITLYIAQQKPVVQTISTFLGHALSLGFLFALKYSGITSLFHYALAFAIAPVIVLLFINAYTFLGKQKQFRPSLSDFSWPIIAQQLRLGVIFFIAQIAWITITSTDNLLISHLFSPEEVVPYSVSIKLFSVPLMLFVLIASPFWSSFTDAHVKDDILWIKKSMKSLEKFILAFVVMNAIILITSPAIYTVWLDEKITVDPLTNVAIFLFTSLVIYNTPYSFYINGRGKMVMQMIVTLLMAVCNVPLSIYLAGIPELKINGIVLSTVCCLLPIVVVTRIQYSKLLNNRAHGFWDR